MYDLIILGGGPAGYNAAERAAHNGLKTLVCEERALGGFEAFSAFYQKRLL